MNNIQHVPAFTLSKTDSRDLKCRVMRLTLGLTILLKVIHFYPVLVFNLAEGKTHHVLNSHT